MAFILTPRLAPAYQTPQCSPFSFCTPISRPSYTYRVARPRPQRPQYSTFNHFFNQVDELLTEIDREAQRQAFVEAQREAHRQRQQRKRALRANFSVDQIEQGWQINGELQGFDQENISIEITNDNTLKILGNTEWHAETNLEKAQNPELDTTTIAEQPAVESVEDKMYGVTLNESEFESVSTADGVTAGADSDTASQKSYQATVEDDFEDLGAETSSLLSSSRPSTPTETREPKGKEKAVEETTAENQADEHTKPETAVSQENQEERVHGVFERTFRFPELIDGASITASFKDGALKITVPRAQTPQSRRIVIS